MMQRIFTQASELFDEDDEEENLVNISEFRILSSLCLQHGIIVRSDSGSENNESDPMSSQQSAVNN